MARQTIDVSEAVRLRGTGLSWRKVGIELAKRDGRRVSYTENGVKNAVRERIKEEMRRARSVRPTDYTRG
jgi:hypothetical protein